MNKNEQKNKAVDNVEFKIEIGDKILTLSLPKNTTVRGLVDFIQHREEDHHRHAPEGMPFVGLASSRIHPLLDFVLTQPHLDFTCFRKTLQLKCLYGY